MISQNNAFHEQLKCFQLFNTKVNNTKETFRRHNHAQKRQQKTSGSCCTSFYLPWVSSHFEKLGTPVLTVNAGSSAREEGV